MAFYSEDYSSIFGTLALDLIFRGAFLSVLLEGLDLAQVQYWVHNGNMADESNVENM